MAVFQRFLNAGFLKEIIPLLVKHNVAANPINYSIWYDYVVGNNPKLTKVLDELASQQKPFDEQMCIDLYKQHVCNASLESFETISNRFQNVINTTSSSLTDTYNKAGESNDSFQKKTALLAAAAPNTDYQAVLKEIIEETQSLAATSQAMQDKLNEANQEMEQLRAELAQARRVAITDGLTGLLNRRAFDDALAEVIETSPAQNTYLTMLDIDHFKSVNDTYGHTIGDNVIKFVAALMKKYAEKHHYVARYGGEEMAIIMPNTSKEKAMEISEAIRSTMEVSRLKRKDTSQTLDKITISIGISELQVGDDSESFIVRAYKALYKAKEFGRNRVIYG